MDAKLTLKLDKSVIDKAKECAASHRKSLSRMIESYLRSVVDKESPDSKEDIEISPFVRNIATGVEMPMDLDYKKAYGDYLSEKYK